MERLIEMQWGVQISTTKFTLANSMWVPGSKHNLVAPCCNKKSKCRPPVGHQQPVLLDVPAILSSVKERTRRSMKG
jgi:hypothetical protein